MLGAKYRILSGLVVFSVITLSFVARAQLYPDSTLLLQSQSPGVDEEDLDSSRYTIKKTRPNQSPKTTLSDSVSPDTQEKPQKSPKPSQPPDVKEPSTNMVSESQNQLLQKSKIDPEKAKEEQDLKSQLRDLVLGGSEERIENYRRGLSRKDTRQNILDVSFAPLYVYTDSSSRFWYRNYQTQAPGVFMKAAVWLSPFFGIEGSYLTTIGSSLRAEPTSTTRIPVEQEWYGAGLRFRKFFSPSRKSPYFSLGINFQEYQLRVPKDAEYRNGIKSRGVKVSLETYAFRSRSYSWIFGVDISPSQTHQEVKTNLPAASGKNEKVVAVGIQLGGEFLFDRRNQFFWKATHEVEQAFYNGTASVADPRTNEAPSGVAVTRGTTTFQLGFKWGY